MASAIIVAGGKGIRMNSRVRKQYLSIDGRPILAHTLMHFALCSIINNIYLVVPEEDIDFCYEQILSPFNLKKSGIQIVAGGAERQDSVCNGLMAADSKDGIVVIHDGVRPFVTPDLITACIKGAEEFGACIPGIPAFDTLKQVNEKGYIETTLPRDVVWLAQTPQAFQYDLIIRAHKTAKNDRYMGTDDASLVERIGKKVKMITGSRRNIKITNKEDIAIAQAIIKEFKP
ncbi:MAG: 2-C-methyl-D-erythritol 4-phosphate cytidylyltransferase [Desulfobacteraceae bacterium]|nr:2-C-methyl-D-erythritol 4-phosphate cytidylyltransferase [Desulfobacteraceae bacterium]